MVGLKSPGLRQDTGPGAHGRTGVLLLGKTFLSAKTILECFGSATKTGTKAAQRCAGGRKALYTIDKIVVGASSQLCFGEDRLECIGLVNKSIL